MNRRVPWSSGSADEDNLPWTRPLVASASGCIDNVPTMGQPVSWILDWRSVIRLARNYSLIPPHCESLRQPVPLPPVPVALRDLQELCVVLVEMMVTSVLRDFVAMFAIFKNMILCPTATPNPTDSTLNQPEEFQEKKNGDGDHFRKLYLSNHGFAIAVIPSFYARIYPCTQETAWAVYSTSHACLVSVYTWTRLEGRQLID